MESMRIHRKDGFRCFIKSMTGFLHRRYKAILYYGAMALILILLAAAAESYRKDGENGQPLVLSESAVQEAIADAGEGILRPEGMRQVRGFSEQMEWNGELKQWELHCANDYVFEGDGVVCLAGGTVADIGESSGRGGFIEIQGYDGRLYRYCSVIPVENILTGAEVDAGEIIAAADNGIPSEFAQGKHLHLEVYEDGILSDFERISGKNDPAAD